jgi:hypothetical protein
MTATLEIRSVTCRPSSGSHFRTIQGCRCCSRSATRRGSPIGRRSTRIWPCGTPWRDAPGDTWLDVAELFNAVAEGVGLWARAIGTVASLSSGDNVMVGEIPATHPSVS